ncbi:MAG TPA: hypothetical protein ENI51_04800 [Candidatus Atribacteria bacterium]|nr:hypothetical protein [Candidatus Atribacteria bacterium]
MGNIFDKMVCRNCDLFQPDPEDKTKGYCWKIMSVRNKKVVSADDGCPSFRPKIEFFDKTVKK